ncbi:MAG: pilus assembly protein TadG-related protein, partial [Spongiibacteraceae bacterium]
MKSAQGSVMPYVAVLLFALAMVVQYVYSAYKISNESTRLQNTADAAAYSAAATVAQSYNFQALSNRAMIANQITVAQLTTMMSWVRMVRTFAGTIYSLTQYIPYVGEVVALVDYYSDLFQTIVEGLMPAFTGAVEAYL